MIKRFTYKTRVFLRRFAHKIKVIPLFFVYKMAQNREEYRRVIYLDEAYKFMWDFEQYLRSQWKWGDPPADIDTIYDYWYQMRNEYNIDL